MQDLFTICTYILAIWAIGVCVLIILSGIVVSIRPRWYMPYIRPLMASMAVWPLYLVVLVIAFFPVVKSKIRRK